MTAATESLAGITLDSLSESLCGFYVPEFSILIEGAGLPDDVLRDVIEVTYEDDLERMDNFQITVSNWDDETGKYKYIGSEESIAASDGSEASNRQAMFEPCSKQVTVKMGYSGDLKTMIKGYFTTMEPSFSASAPATLNVRGINVLQRLRTKQYSDFFTTLKPSTIATEVGARRDPDLNALRLPIEIRTNPQSIAAERSIDFLAQKNEYSIDFLWKLSRREGYVLSYFEQDGAQPPYLYFGPSAVGDALTDSIYELKLGQSLIDFKPRITTANQFRKVTVNGWNRQTQRTISESVSFDDPEMQNLNADLRYMLCMCDAREELVVDEPVFNEREAHDRATALLLDQHKQMVTVSGTTIGLPLLKSGRKVRISNVGARLNGDYFITKTQHIFNSSGYITKFDGRREHIPESGASAS
jgi:uncharacterized protein